MGWGRRGVAYYWVMPSSPVRLGPYHGRRSSIPRVGLGEGATIPFPSQSFCLLCCLLCALCIHVLWYSATYSCLFIIVRSDHTISNYTVCPLSLNIANRFLLFFSGTFIDFISDVNPCPCPCPCPCKSSPCPGPCRLNWSLSIIVLDTLVLAGPVLDKSYSLI